MGIAFPFRNRYLSNLLKFVVATIIPIYIYTIRKIGVCAEGTFVHSVDMYFDWNDNQIFDKLIENSIIGNAMIEFIKQFKLGLALQSNMHTTCW